MIIYFSKMKYRATTPNKKVRKEGYTIVKNRENKN